MLNSTIKRRGANVVLKAVLHINLLMIWSLIGLFAVGHFTTTEIRLESRNKDQEIISAWKISLTRYSIVLKRYSSFMRVSMPGLESPTFISSVWKNDENQLIGNYFEFSIGPERLEVYGNYLFYKGDWYPAEKLPVRLIANLLALTANCRNVAVGYFPLLLILICSYLINARLAKTMLLFAAPDGSN